MKNIALSSMALLGLTRAQLFIERSKTFTVHSVTPMNRLLTLVDSGNDDMVVSLNCVDRFTDAHKTGPYEYYFNDIHRADVGYRFCPVDSFSDEKNSFSVDFGERGDWKSNCETQLGEMTPFDNQSLINAWDEAPGSMTCAPGDQLNIEIRNRWESSVSMEYNLDDWQYACIEDDFLSIFFGFSKREFFESKDLCFSNEDYID